MKWLVTIKTENVGPRRVGIIMDGSATVEVWATNRSDAEYRAAVQIGNTYKVRTERVIACRQLRD